MWIFWLIVVLVLGFGAYVRLAPSDPERWHVPLNVTEDRDLPGGAERVLPGEGDRLADLDRIARATPRTERLAGSVEEGRLTYITRTNLWGFPDYTTAERKDGDLMLHARLRFGRGDMGVNRARLDSWIRQLHAG
ncbi:DUF1499 domain-containing protein [Aquicoccus sp. SCR17]|nr:DUF1499 domain-containing protein [Carideicomes alvinocaridis]